MPDPLYYNTAPDEQRTSGWKRKSACRSTLRAVVNDGNNLLMARQYFVLRNWPPASLSLFHRYNEVDNERHIQCAIDSFAAMQPYYNWNYSPKGLVSAARPNYWDLHYCRNMSGISRPVGLLPPSDIWRRTRGSFQVLHCKLRGARRRSSVWRGRSLLSENGGKMERTRSTSSGERTSFWSGKLARSIRQLAENINQSRQRNLHSGSRLNRQ